MESQLRELAGDVDKAVRLWISQRPQDDGIDDGKDGGVGADAERERQDPDECKTGVRRRFRAAWRTSRSKPSIPPPSGVSPTPVSEEQRAITAPQEHKNDAVRLKPLWL